MITLLAILAVVSSDVRRCALPYLTGLDRPQPTVPSAAPRVLATNLQVFQTEHFAFWWSVDPSGTHRIIGDPAKILVGDSVPEIVRVSSNALEKAWKTYVDSLHYLPPIPSAQSYLWNQVSPAGKYPVELCNVGTALNDYQNYYGVAVPNGASGQSNLMLASNLVSFGDHVFYTRDLDGAKVEMNYATQWREAIKATCVHELFHAVQFNYETNIGAHGFFEASAVAMETRLVPESYDYLQFCPALAKLDQQTPFPTGLSGDAYPGGWQVRSMMDDLGVEVVKALWESRQATHSNPPSFLTTLRQILPQAPFHGSFDTQLVRHSVRVALTGRRSVWHPSELSTFPDADQFPTLSGGLWRPDLLTPLPLALGGIQVVIDTLAYIQDRIFVWVPDEGVLMAYISNSQDMVQVSWHKGSVRVPATVGHRSIWTLANPGNPRALWSAAHTDSSLSHYALITASPQVSVQDGQILSWTSGDGFTLSGKSLTQGGVTPMLHLDVWHPLAAKDPFAARVANGARGHSLILEDADHRLSLTDANLRLNGLSVGKAYFGSGDGNWQALGVTQTAGASVLELGTLDLSNPLRILVDSADPLNVHPSVRRSGPSLLGGVVRFPTGIGGTDQLEIFTVNGGLVRELKAQAGQSEVVWDLRNRHNQLVKPGVYWYVWRGTAGPRPGQFLIAR